MFNNPDHEFLSLFVLEEAPRGAFSLDPTIKFVEGG